MNRKSRNNAWLRIHMSVPAGENKVLLPWFGELMKNNWLKGYQYKWVWKPPCCSPTAYSFPPGPCSLQVNSPLWVQAPAEGWTESCVWEDQSWGGWGNCWGLVWRRGGWMKTVLLSTNTWMEVLEMGGIGLFFRVTSNRTRGNSLKLC